MQESAPRSEKDKLENLLQLLSKAIHSSVALPEVDLIEGETPAATTEFSTLNDEDRLALQEALSECGFRESANEAIAGAMELRDKVSRRIATFAK